MTLFTGYVCLHPSSCCSLSSPQCNLYKKGYTAITASSLFLFFFLFFFFFCFFFLFCFSCYYFLKREKRSLFILFFFYFLFFFFSPTRGQKLQTDGKSEVSQSLACLQQGRKLKWSRHSVFLRVVILEGWFSSFCFFYG